MEREFYGEALSNELHTQTKRKKEETVYEKDHFVFGSDRCFLMLPFNIFSQEKAEAPTYKDGDSWQFRLNQGTVLTQTTRAQAGIMKLPIQEASLKFGHKVKTLKALPR